MAFQFQLVELDVLALVLPVEEKHVLEQFRQLAIGLDTLAIVILYEELDMQRQHKHGPRALSEHGPCHLVGIDIEAIAGRQRLAHHRLDAAEQRLVLDLLVAEPHQRLERVLVAQPVVAADLELLGGDKPLDQAEDVGVGAALDLAGKAFLVVGE